MISFMYLFSSLYVAVLTDMSYDRLIGDVNGLRDFTSVKLLSNLRLATCLQSGFLSSNHRQRSEKKKRSNRFEKPSATATE